MNSPEPDVPAVPWQVHLVPHTHWDREWYHVASRFRQRLVALVDAVLADSSVPFLLDGQAVTLRDYLAVRPEAEPVLRAALQQGALEAGPWYVLADNLIPSGEAIVRNLEAGRRALRQLGALAPAVAYCPDTFGHPAAMPTIAAGFGLDVAVVWRGAGGAQHPFADAFHWTAADGSRVLTHHLPPDGYEFGSALPADRARAHERWRHLSTLWQARATTPVQLLLNGADHHARQPDLVAAVAALGSRAGAAARVRVSSLRAWADAFAAAATAVSPPLPEWVGELRDSYGYTWTLAGTYGTRAHLKRRNARLERALLRDVEPWLALARLHAPTLERTAPHLLVSTPNSDAARLTLDRLPVLLDCAWEDLLRTHPHDTLCGCSVDAVARAMDVRQEAVAAQTEGLRAAALQVVLQHDDVAARDRGDFDWRRIVLRNRAPRARGGLALVRLVETVRDVPVGPASAPVAVANADRITAATVPSKRRSPDTGGMLSQALGRRTCYERRESPQHYPDNDLVREHRMLMWVPPVPAFGVTAWHAPDWEQAGPTPLLPVRVLRNEAGVTIDNGRMRLSISRRTGEVAAAAPFALTVDDRVLPALLSFETRHDAGDSYTPSLRGDAETLRCTTISLAARGPLRAVVRTRWRTKDGSRVPSSVGRIDLVADLVVDAMSPVLQCVVRGTSWRTDHRLQLVWRTDVHGGRTWADAAFGPVERVPVVAPAHSRESVPEGMPMHRWVMNANPMFGATMIGDGLAEAVVQDGRLATTLVRGVGQLSRADLPERPGHAGWPAATPLAQCVGPFAATSALFLHGPMSDDVLARVRDACDDVLLPLVGETWRDLEWHGTRAGVELVGEAFELSSVTTSATDPHAIVVRVVNNTQRPAWGALRLPGPGPWQVVRCRLDETVRDEPVVVEHAFSFEATPRAVLTVRVKPLSPSVQRPDARTAR